VNSTSPHSVPTPGNPQTPVAEAAPLPDPSVARLRVRANELLAERQGTLPVWVRAPKGGPEFYSGVSRAKLYEWHGKGYIRAVSVREPGQVKGCRFFHLGSILAFIEKCEAKDNEAGAQELRASADTTGDGQEAAKETHQTIPPANPANSKDSPPEQ
jgi:hypothetical protein